MSFESIPTKKDQEPVFNFELWLNNELPKQYIEKAQILNKNGLLHVLTQSQEFGIIGPDGQEYPFPKLETIKAEMLENREFYQTKMSQGFTEMEIVPFLELEKLIKTVEKAILRHHKEGKLFATKKDASDPNEKLVPLELKENQPLFVWDEYLKAEENGTLIYDPQEFSQNNHRGKDKMEMLKYLEKSSFPGYLVRLREKNVNIPRAGQGKTLNGRKQLEAGLNSREYLKALQEKKEYQGEAGQNAEDWLIKFLTHLEKTNEVIDNWQGNGSVALLIGAYFTASDGVPGGSWFRSLRQADLGRHDPDYRNGGVGVASVVRVERFKI